MENEPEYRLQRRAEEAAAWQALVNLFRRLLRLPIRKTAAEARRDELERY